MTDREVVLGTGNAPGPQRGRVREFVANRSGTQRARRHRRGARPHDRALRRSAVRHGSGRRTRSSWTSGSTSAPSTSPSRASSRHRAPARGGGGPRPAGSWSSGPTVTNHTDRAEFASLATDAFAGEHTGAIPWPETPTRRARLRRGRRRQGPAGRVHQPRPDLYLRLAAPAAAGHRPRRTHAGGLRLRVPVEVDPADPGPEPVGSRTTGRSSRDTCPSRWCRDRAAGDWARRGRRRGRRRSPRHNPPRHERRHAGPSCAAAEVGEVDHLSYADVQVTDVRPAKYVAGLTSTDYAKQAGGVFVLVSVKVTATREPTTFLSQHLVDEDDRRTRPPTVRAAASMWRPRPASRRTRCSASTSRPSRLAGMRFQLGRGSPILSDTARATTSPRSTSGSARPMRRLGPRPTTPTPPRAPAMSRSSCRPSSSPRRLVTARTGAGGGRTGCGWPPCRSGWRPRRPRRPTTSRTSGTTRACITRWRPGSRAAGWRSARSSPTASATLAAPTGSASTGSRRPRRGPYYDDGPREPPDGIDAVVAHLDWEADPDQELFGLPDGTGGRPGAPLRARHRRLPDLCTPGTTPGRGPPARR